MSITVRAIREEVSLGLRLRVRGIVAATAAGPPVTIDVNAVGDLLSQSAAPISSFVSKVGDVTDYPRVTVYSASDARLTLNRNHGTPFAVDDAVDIYSILTPLDWNLAIKNSGARLYRLVRFVIPLIVDQPEYSLATLAPWLVTREQVEEVKIRKTDGSSNDFVIYEEAHPAWELELDDNVATMRFHSLPTDQTDISFPITARRYYDGLTDETSVFSGTDFLIKSATKVEALRVTWALMGEREAKDMFANELSEALNDLADAKRHFLPRVSPHPLHFPTPFTGPELPIRPNSWRW